MINKQMNDAVAAIALLTQSEQDRLIAFLQSPASIMSEPVADKPLNGRRKSPFAWTDEYTAMAKDAAEDNMIQSPSQRKLSLEKLAAAIGTEYKVVQRKIDSIRRNNKK